MRQAGRYMHEYQKLRAHYSFLDICYNPELITQVTMMPIDAFGFDAAIVFSDILLITQALGMNLRFDEASGPILQPALKGSLDVSQLKRGQVRSHFEFLSKAIKTLKQSLDVSLLGFAGAPFTVASYMVEGKSSRDFARAKRWILEDPQSFSQLIDILVEETVALLEVQIEAGVDAVQLFDSWAMQLPCAAFDAYVKAPLEKIIKRLNGFPVILFSRGQAANRLATLQPQGVSLDWTESLKDVRMQNPTLTLQGNLDPEVLLTNPKVIEREARRLLQEMAGDPGFIFNLGHGVLKDTPRENVEALVSCVKS